MTVTQEQDPREDALPCIACARACDSAAAALATVAHYHGLACLPDDFGPLLGLDPFAELPDLLVAARLLGFESVPLEGSYDDLPSVSRPNLVVLRDGEESCFAVLFEIDDSGVVIADVVAGRVVRLSREEFCARWTGDCVQVDPLPERLAVMRERLAVRRSAWKRIVRVLGFAPPRGPKLLFVAGASSALALACGAGMMGGAVGGAMVLLGVAALASLWLSLFYASCAACGQAHQLAGKLPLDRAGAAFYLSLLVLAQFSEAGRYLAYPLCFASGVHLALLVTIARRKIACRPCVVAGLSALVATGLLAWATEPAMPLALGLELAGFAAAGVALPFFRDAATHAGLFEARRVALAAVAGPRTGGAVRIVVWKRGGCSSCLFYEAALKPALVEELGEAIVIEERDAAGLGVPVPLILVAAPVPVLFVGLPRSHDDLGLLRLAVESAREQAVVSLASLGGIHIVQTLQREG